MTEQTDDPILTELQAALEIEPSPEFAAKVRVRVTERNPARRGSVLMLVGGLSVAALTVLFVWSQPVRPVLPASAPAPVVAAASEVVRLAPATPRPQHAAHTSVGATKAVARQPAREPEVLTNQPAILRAMWARMSTATPVEEESQVSAEETKPFEASPIEIRLLKVAPIVIRSLDEFDDKE